MNLGLQGKTALVLGGSKGLERGVAGAPAAEDVAVALLERGREAPDKAVAEITACGGRAIAVAADLGDWQAVERAAHSIPVARMGKPAEFGAAAAFLASPLAGYITGSTIRVDGGTIRSV